jgi:hypothetical protein
MGGLFLVECITAKNNDDDDYKPVIAKNDSALKCGGS